MEDLSKYNPEGSVLRNAQLRMLEMLKEVDAICRKNNIRYWMDFGTLLGAVRHKGFIPWDDDIDICIMHEDYKRLREVLNKELPPQFVLQDSKSDSHAYFYYGRVRDKNSYCYYPNFTKLKEQGLCLDIFIVDRIGSVKMRNFADFFFRRAHREVHHYGDVAYSSKTVRYTKRFLAYIMFPFAYLLVSIAKATNLFCKEKHLTRFAFNDETDALESNVFPLTELEYEGCRFMAPHNYDGHLKLRYGDYMRFPPEEKRKPLMDINKTKVW